MDDQSTNRAGGRGATPRFGLKPVLITVAIAALWLSTLRGYPGSGEVQSFIWVAIVVMSGVAIFHSSGRLRAFWMGFFGTALLGTTQAIARFGSGFRVFPQWSRSVAEYLQPPQLRQGQLTVNIHSALTLLTVLVAAVLIGLLCAYVFGRREE